MTQSELDYFLSKDMDWLRGFAAGMAFDAEYTRRMASTIDRDEQYDIAEEATQTLGHVRPDTHGEMQRLYNDIVQYWSDQLDLLCMDP